MARITVIGGTLAGMAAAARLAKRRHEVTLVASAETLVEDAFAKISDHPVADDTSFAFPAPWRDLFRKSGRTLDAELARHSLTLAPAPGRMVGVDRWELPPERGAQFTVLSERFGEPVAERWRDLLDGLDTVWQHRRRLGMEFTFDPRAHRTARGELWSDRTVADLADGLPDELADLVRSTATGAPDRSPAVDAVWLAVERTFGRWQLLDANGHTAPTSTLIEVLAGRLRQRRVQVVLEPPAHADAVVDARVHAPKGAWFRRPGPRRRLRRNRYVCGEHTKAGTGPVGQLLSAALATYAAHLDLTGTDIHPSVKDT